MADRRRKAEPEPEAEVLHTFTRYEAVMPPPIPVRPILTNRDEFCTAVATSGPEGYEKAVADEIFRHRQTRDGVTPEDLDRLRSDLMRYCTGEVPGA